MPNKICRLCGKEFYTVSTGVFCRGPHYTECEVCGKIFEIKDPNNVHRTCSKECKKALRKQSIQATPRICELCGKEFYSSSNTARYCDGPHYRPCPICGKPVEIRAAYEEAHCCSQACTNKLREQTNLAEYGVRIASQAEEVREKLQKAAKDNNQSRIKTIQYKYGDQYTNIAQVPAVKEKIRASVTSVECVERIKQTNLERTGYEYAMQCPELRSKQSRNSKQLSNLEIRLHNMLNEMHISYVEHHVVSSGKLTHEFDVFLPDYKILIDCDGVYWHAYLDDPDGEKVRDDYDEVRLTLIPNDHIFHLIVESDFERGLRELQKIIRSIDSSVFDYDSDLFRWCRSIGFPYPSYSDERLKKDFASLCKYTTDSYNSYCKLGTSLIRQFHKSIYHCNVQGCISPYEAWQSDELIKKCIANRLIYQNDVDPAKVLNGFNISKIAPKVSVFNPVLAKHLTQKYLDEFVEVFDPFSGFSGRMLGVCAASKYYIGQDISSIRIDESSKIKELLHLNAELHTQDIFESTVTSAECLLTCPPYSDKETYDVSGDVYSCDEWIDYVTSTIKCRRYVFVVDNTERYRNKVVETITNKSHFGSNFERVVIIDK